MKRTGILLFLLVFTAGNMVWAQSTSKETATIQTKIRDEYNEALKRIDSTKLGEAISDIVKKRAEAEEQKVFKESGKGLPGVWSVIFPSLMVLLVVVSAKYFRYKKKRELYLLIAKFVETGKEVPAELLNELKPISKGSDLRSGLLLLSFGVAIVIGAYISVKDLMIIGLIPLLLGIAYIISHFLIQGKVDN